MRTIMMYLMVAIDAIGTGALHAQQCPQEVSTDPRNPSNPARPELENTFFWFPHNGDLNANFELITPGGTYPFIASPFWAETTLSSFQLFGQQDSDFYPEDGWELLKVNFGRLNNGTQRTVLPNMPYMTLYNKYTGTMRFMGMWPNASNSWQIIRFRVSLPKYKYGGNPEADGSKLQASNLLSIQGDTAQPLDQKTEENVYEIITEYPGISNASYFFWFDLPVAYDPCVCYNDVGIQLEASVENNWNVTIKGVIDAQIIQQGTPTGQNHSALIANRVIGAAGATATAIVTGGAIVQTGPIIGLLDIFRQRPGISGQAQRNLQLIQQTMTAASTAVWDPVKMQWRNTVTDSTMNKSDWDKLFAGIGSFLNAGVDYLSPSAKASAPRTSVVGTITATGTATLNSPSGDLVYWGVPASAWTNSLNETVSNSANGLLPEYLIYNNPLGTLALLKTPTLNVKKLSDAFLYNCSTDGEIVYLCEYYSASRYQIFLGDQDIKYYLNPVLNVNDERTEIFASLVIKEKIKQFVREPCAALEDDLCCNSTVVPCYQQLVWHRGKNIYPGIDLTERITNPVPLNYINEMVAEFTADGQAGFDQFDYFIRFRVDIESLDIGRNGDPVKESLIITFPLNPNSTTESPSFPVVDIENDQLPEIIGSPNGVGTIVGDKYRSGYIEVSGFLSSWPGLSASVLSSSVIHLKPGAHINPDLRLAIDYPFQGMFPQYQVDATYVHNFCQNQILDLPYMANQFSSKAIDLPSPPYELLEPYLLTRQQEQLNQIKLHPNPTSGLLQITSSSQPITQIEVYDLSGRRLYHQSFGESHGRQVQTDLSALSNGVYVVKTTCADQVCTQKLVVGR